MDQKVKVDYIIVGQGIAGSWLAYELLQRGKKIILFNVETANCSSMKAAGLYNPITGKKHIKTWMADSIFPRLEAKYQEIEKKLSSHFLHPLPIYRPFTGIDSLNDWEGKITDSSYAQYVQSLSNKSKTLSNIHDPYGGVTLNYTGYLNLKSFIEALRTYFIQNECYRPEPFDYTQMELSNEGVCYQDCFASKVIFCEGALSENPYFKDLPFRFVRGETINAKLDLNTDIIVNQGVFIIPKKDYFTIGSTYDHKILTYTPQQKGIDEVTNKLMKIYKGNLTILESNAGVRPATFDRKPFIGLHKEFESLAIFNGFGTKGVSLVPYFTSHFIDFLDQKSELNKEVSIERVN